MTERGRSSGSINLGDEVFYRDKRWRLDDEALIGLEGQSDLTWDEFDPDELEPALA